MKLDCAVVKDLYVLYKEGELSEEVKNALEDHLRDCPDCCQTYETESGFKDVLQSTEEKKPSKKMDEKIMLSLKIRRLQIAVLFIVAIFATTSINGYFNRRSHLRSDLAHVEQSLWQMHLGLDNIKSQAYQPASFLINAINDRNNIIYRNLNATEKRLLREKNGELFLHPRVVSLRSTLNKRYLAQTWSERDELVLEEMTASLYEAVELLTEERLTLNNIHNNKLRFVGHRINISELAKIYNDINLLALTYTDYGKLPQEISLLTEEELQARLLTLFPGAEITNISGREQAAIWGQITFNLIHEGTTYHGELDAFTGDILTVNSNAVHSGPLLPVESVEGSLKEFLSVLHGQNYTYQTEYLGINYRFSSNVDVKLYTWKVYPVLDGYRFDSVMIVRIDARTGKLYMYNTEGSPVYTLKPEPDTRIHVTPEEALTNAELPEGISSDIPYQETLLIHSILTGKIQPAHLYTQGDWQLYINAVNGKPDVPR